MSSTPPSEMFAMVAGKGPSPQKQQIPVPSLESNQALVKVAYAAQNPTDGISSDVALAGDDLLSIL